MDYLLIALDLFLLLGLTARLTLFVTTDSLGALLIRDPMEAWARRGLPFKGKTFYVGEESYYSRRDYWVSGIYCPWCVGFWLGAATMLSLYIMGGVGSASETWRLVAGIFTINLIVAPLTGALVSSSDD